MPNDEKNDHSPHGIYPMTRAGPCKVDEFGTTSLRVIRVLLQLLADTVQMLFCPNEDMPIGNG